MKSAEEAASAGSPALARCAFTMLNTADSIDPFPPEHPDSPSFAIGFVGSCVGLGVKVAVGDGVAVGVSVGVDVVVAVEVGVDVQVAVAVVVGVVNIPRTAAVN